MAVEHHLLYGEPDFACTRVARVRVSSTVDDNYPARLQQGHLESYLLERADQLRGDALVNLRVEVSRWHRLIRRRRMTLHGHVVRYLDAAAPPVVDLRGAMTPRPDAPRIGTDR